MVADVAVATTMTIADAIPTQVTMTTASNESDFGTEFVDAGDRPVVESPEGDYNANVGRDEDVCVSVQRGTLPGFTDEPLVEDISVVSHATESSGILDTVLSNVSSVDTESVVELLPPIENTAPEITTNKAELELDVMLRPDTTDIVEPLSGCSEDDNSETAEPGLYALDSLSDDLVMIRAEVVTSVVEENTSPNTDLDIVETQVGCTDIPLESSCDEQLEIRDSVKSELKTVDCAEPRSHGRVFTPSELNRLWKGLSIGADDETEEYDKELEERLYPLDEVELKRRMEQNAERLGSLTLEEMSTLLNIPIAILEKNSESSPGELSTPEYWLVWYNRTLVAAEGAKRANRDFRKDPSDRKVKNDESYPADEDDRDVGGGVNLVAEEVRQGPRAVKSNVVDEVDLAAVVENIGVDLLRYERQCLDDAEPSEDQDWISASLAFMDGCTLHVRWRSLVRQTVYALVKDDELAFNAKCAHCQRTTPVEGSDCTLESRIRDKLAKLGEIRESVISGQLVEAVNRPYDANAKLIGAKMLVRGSKCRRCRKDVVPSRRLKPVKGVRFDHSSLFAERSEAFYDSAFERDETCDLYDYVYVGHDNAAVKQQYL